MPRPRNLFPDLGTENIIIVTMHEVHPVNAVMRQPARDEESEKQMAYVQEIRVSALCRSENPPISPNFVACEEILTQKCVTRTLKLTQ